MSEPTPRRLLFICRLNRSRSATAERLFAKRTDLDVRSAGTAPDATFAGHSALGRVVCLDIPDDFTFLQPELVELLEQRVPQHLATI